jgi:hypothetical protein
MNNVLVFEGAHDVDDDFSLSNVMQELVAETFAVTGASSKAGNIDEFDGRGDIFVVCELRQRREPAVRNTDYPDICADSTERVIGALRPRRRERVEECRFPDIRQTDDSCT